jgi:hypothetical protein
MDTILISTGQIQPPLYMKLISDFTDFLKKIMIRLHKEFSNGFNISEGVSKSFRTGSL